MSRDEVMFLLGAGASVDAGLPLASQLTERVVSQLAREDSDDGKKSSLIIRYVIDRISAHAKTKGQASTPDIETVVSTVELLQDRSRFELAPFVKAWDPGLDATIDYEWRINVLLQALYAALVSVLDLPTDRDLGYLRPLVSLGGDEDGVTIATLNYDLTVERAARDAGIPLTCGVDQWERDERVMFANGSVRLMKLHGSLDWVRGDYSPPPGQSGVPRTRLVLRPAGPGDLPFLVFGRREKLRPAGPFLSLRSEFHRRLGQASCLVVVGYSFADAHINELISQWINADPRREIVVVDPGFPCRFDNAVGFTRLLYADLALPPRIGPNMAGGRLWVIRESAAAALLVVCHRSAASVLESVQAHVEGMTEPVSGMKG